MIWIIIAIATIVIIGAALLVLVWLDARRSGSSLAWWEWPVIGLFWYIIFPAGMLVGHFERRKARRRHRARR